MKVLVTGGTGLVGSRLLKHFVNEGITCRALIRAGKAVPFDVEIVEGDLFDATSLQRAVEGVSAVIHLAAVFRTQDEHQVWRANLDGTAALISAVQEFAPESRFLMASTSLVYGEAATRPGREDDELHPTLAYPASKLAAEKLLQESGLNWSVLRLAFIYGDGDGHLASVPKIVEVMRCHPAQAFSMAHQRDVARAFQFALNGAMDGHVVNIVDDAPSSLYEMASIVGITLEPSGAPLEHPWMGRADGARSRKLGSRPTIATMYQAAAEKAL